MAGKSNNAGKATQKQAKKQTSKQSTHTASENSAAAEATEDRDLTEPIAPPKGKRLQNPKADDSLSSVDVAAPEKDEMELVEWSSLEEANKAYNDLMVKFQNLQNLRITEPERLLKDFTKAADRERSASSQLVKALEVKLASAMHQFEAAQEERQRWQSSAEEQSAQIEEKQAKIEELQTKAAKADEAFMAKLDEKLQFFTRLTGVEFEIKNVPRKKKSKEPQALREMLVKHSGKNGVLQYKLVDRDDSLMDFICGEQQLNPDIKLPEYLSEDIEFEQDQLQAFFWQILDVLCKEP